MGQAKRRKQLGDYPTVEPKPKVETKSVKVGMVGGGTSIGSIIAMLSQYPNLPGEIVRSHRKDGSDG